MSKLTWDINEFHWIMQVVDTMDAGLLVVDDDYNVCVWNSFMQSYSGINSQDIMGDNLFEVCPELPENWLKTKINTVKALATKSFSSWEDRPYLFQFSNFSPVSQGLEFMYQDIILTPLRSLSGSIDHVSIMINDVSDIARNKMQLRESNQNLSKISRTDGLTGLYNRCYWEACLQTEFNRSQLSDAPCSLVMFDIDKFKHINDSFGHTSGDTVIRAISSVLKKSTRTSDICGRYGGEEFSIILPNTKEEHALYFAERLRQRIENESVNVNGQFITVTVSLGVCELMPSMHSYLDWINKVDLSLYKSKENGRNQTTVYDGKE